MPRYRANFLSGVASGVQNSTGQTVITGTNWPTNIPTGSYLPVTLNPGYFGANNTSGPEIIYVTSVSSNVATVVRQQENSSLASGTIVPWVAGPLVSDFDASNLSSSGTVTFSGNFVVVSGITNTNLLTTSGLTVQNNAIISGGLAVNSGSQLYNGIYTTGYFNAQGAGGFQGTLNLFGGLAVQSGNATVNNALTTSGLTVQNNAVISGGLNVTGNLNVNGNTFFGQNITTTGYSTALGGFYYSTSNKTASGTSQSTATPINTQYTIVISGTTATSNGQTGQAAVVLPNIAYLGQTILIDNSTSNWLLVYPYSTQQIDSAGSSNPVWLAPSAYWEGVAETTGSWASFVPSFNSDSSNSINIVYTNGQIQYGINPAIQATSLTVSGTTTLNSLSVANEVDTGNLTVGGNLTAGGTSIQLPSGVLQVGLGATVTGNLSVSGNITTSGGKVVTNLINSPGYTAYSTGSTGGLLVNGVQFPILNTSSGITYLYTLTSGNYLTNGIQTLTLNSGTWLLTGRVTGAATATASTDLWIGPSYTTASGCYGITTTTFTSNPVTATITCIATITGNIAVYLQGYQAASPVSTVTLYSGGYYSATVGGVTSPYSNSTVTKSTSLTAFQLA